MHRTGLLITFCLVVFFFAFADSVKGQGWGSTDFLVTDPGTNQIAVFDQNLIFQHYLPNPPNEPWGLTFLPNGNLVVAARNPSRIKIYNNTGATVSDFTDVNIGNPVDVKATATSRIIVPRESAVVGNAIADFTAAGVHNGNFGTGSFYSAGVLPGNILWVGDNSSGLITVFDLATNAPAGTLPLDNGQVRTDTMFYSMTTSTVLMTGSAGFNAVYERNLSGGFVRQFTTPANEFVNFGVTRGPAGRVYATVFFGAKIHQWTSLGAFVSTTDISAFTTNPANILWAGAFNPSAAGASISGRVTNGNGNGIPKARITLTGDTGTPQTINVSPLGYFTFEDVPTGGTYILNVEHKWHQFEAQSINVLDSVSDLSFVPVGTGNNPIKKGRL